MCAASTSELSKFVVPSSGSKFQNEPEEATEGHSSSILSSSSTSENEVVSLLYIYLLCHYGENNDRYGKNNRHTLEE